MMAVPGSWPHPRAPPPARFRPVGERPLSVLEPQQLALELAQLDELLGPGVARNNGLVQAVLSLTSFRRDSFGMFRADPARVFHRRRSPPVGPGILVRLVPYDYNRPEANLDGANRFLHVSKT